MKSPELFQQRGANEYCRTRSAGERLLKRWAKRVGALACRWRRTVARDEKLDLRIPEMPCHAGQTARRVPGIVIRKSDDRRTIECLAVEEAADHRVSRRRRRHGLFAGDELRPIRQLLSDVVALL